MVQFKRYKESGLYINSRNQEGASWWGFVITEKLDEPPIDPISLHDALQNEQWKGSLVYVAANATKIAENAQPFIGKIRKILEHFINDGALIFLLSGKIDEIDATRTKIIPLRRAAGKITPNQAFDVTLTGVSGVDADINSQVEFSVPASAANEYILFSPTGSKPAVTLGGKLAPNMGIPPTSTAKLHFAGTANGAFSFSLLIDETSLIKDLNMGFQVTIPNLSKQKTEKGDDPVPYLAALLPLAETSPQSPTTLGFSAQINILNPNNQVAGASPTVFYFSGKNGPGSEQPNTELVSYYRTNYGKKVRLIPAVAASDGQQRAGLVINPGCAQSPLQNGFRFAPVGDFVLAVEEEVAAGTPQKVLCGLSGTETIAFLPQIDKTQVGTRLRFVANQPANTPQFPLKAASPVGPPIDPTAGLLDSKYETSWVSFVAPPSDPARSAHYSAAPKGAELFGRDTSEVAGLLGPEDPGVGLPPDGSVVFPMLPLAGFKAGEGVQDVAAVQLELLSRQIVSPTRKSRINSAGAAKPSPSAHVSLFPEIAREAAADDGLTSTTTPTGFITRYKKSDGSWKQLLLSQVQDQSVSVTRQMGFTDLQGDLQAAFQTSDQFLIVANNKYLGTPASGAFMPPSPEDIADKNLFYNTINIGKWNFAVPAGEKNSYGDYSSVMIVKGVKGKIFDIDAATGEVSHDSLVLSPDKWTMKDKFAAPSVVVEDGANGSISEPRLSQLIPLSNWLVEYCQAAYNKKNTPYFANFTKILQDENWTGVLILKAAIADLPAELAGIAAGVKDPSDFYVHHIGIEIGQIDGTKVEQKDTTSMFGLVYYVDPRYDDAPTAHAIAPSDLSASYDFTLLTLKALFENSAVKKFESLAQMVLNNLFGSVVKKMGGGGNIYNAVLLEGGVQKNGDAVIYSLSSRTANRYYQANNILTSVEIDTAQMSTRDDGSKSGKIVSWIGMSGYMSFCVVAGKDSLPDFDIFSFGSSDPDSTKLRQGLNFSNLGLQITIPKQEGDDEPPPPILELIESEISFNSVSSTPRDESIYKSFQLELLGMLAGNANPEKKEEKGDPQSLGYLTVATQYGLQGVTSGKGTWHALRFKLNLGTPGALAGKVNLDSSLLVAWSDDSGASEGSSGYQAMVGIELPGTGSGGDLFSLQTVIKLSIGAIQLFYAPPVTKKPKKPDGFLLLLNEIALKLLGLLKIPPSGNTAFFLFGNQEVAKSTGLGWFAVYNKAKK